MEIFTTILAAILGLYISNIFTWKIKDKIDALDILYKDILKLNNLFLNFIRENVNADEDKVELDKINEMHYKIQPYQENAYFYCLVADGHYNGKTYNLYITWANMMIEIINGANKHNWSNDLDIKFRGAYKFFVLQRGEEAKEIVQEYESLMNKASKSIFDRRKKLISFPYMLRRLFCNKCGGMIIIVIIMSAIITHYLDQIKPAVAPIIEIFMQ